jgi:hypothetical protein
MLESGVGADAAGPGDISRQPMALASSVFKMAVPAKRS